MFRMYRKCEAEPYWTLPDWPQYALHPKHDTHSEWEMCCHQTNEKTSGKMFFRGFSFQNFYAHSHELVPLSSMSNMETLMSLELLSLFSTERQSCCAALTMLCFPSSGDNTLTVGLQDTTDTHRHIDTNTHTDTHIRFPLLLGTIHRLTITSRRLNITYTTWP